MTTTLKSVLLHKESGVHKHPEAYALQTPIANHHSSRDKALDREDGSQLLAQFHARIDVIVIIGVHDGATDTSAEARKLEGKLDALTNLVTQLAANEKPASLARVCDIHSSNDHHTSVCPSSQQSGVDEHPEAYAVNTYSRPPQRREKALDREDGSQLLAVQLAANQKPASVATVCAIRSSNDHHTSGCPSSQQSGVDEHPEAYAANIYSRPPQQQGQGT
ncbi:hypothetical protein Fmac_015266 [Flemingia macrophylla]|uniref:Uncharacterized protein n=1 Tax=Flemingia macrophylla TaxID=520843 RepID=A0ABD1MF01_9FABA